MNFLNYNHIKKVSHKTPLYCFHSFVDNLGIEPNYKPLTVLSFFSLIDNSSFRIVEDKRLELLTPCVQGRCSTN
jgi:hypothetical protein